MQRRFVTADFSIVEMIRGSQMGRYLDSLNPEQKKAVMQLDGPVLIMAGAGSGKTKALTCRIAYMLEAGVHPSEILAITFTNKAAKEMRERVHALVGPEAEKIWMYTFHSFGARFLRMEIEALPPYTREFSIYDAEDAKSVVKAIIKEMNLDDKLFQPRSIAAKISNAKNALQSPAAFASEVGTFHDRKVAEIYAEYDKRLKKNNAVDFDDLLLLTTKLLEKKEIRERWQRRFRYIEIDEYQDTNHAQYLMAKYIAGESQNICAVGDGDQSIYSWRGADMRNILDFKKDYPQAKIIKLEQNYRSTKTILTAANAVIRNNNDRVEKNLWTQNQKGAPIRHYHGYDEREEADFIVRAIREEHQAGRPYSDMAVLYRMNAQSRALEEALNFKGMAYALIGDVPFFGRREVKDIMAYLRLLANFRDDVSFRRIVNVPKRGIGAAAVEALSDFAASQNTSLFEALMACEAGPFTAAVKKKLQAFGALIFGFLNASTELSLSDLLEKVIRETQYAEYLRELKESDEIKEAREANIGELFTMAGQFSSEHPEGTLSEFLEEKALVAETDKYDETADRVTLMTLHSAKGLEFPIVFLAGMNEGIFPILRGGFTEDAEMEEERRLCYVGITRAKERLYVTDTDVRMVYGKTQQYLPSRFLEEIPEDLKETMNRDDEAEKQRDMRRRYDSQASKYALSSAYFPKKPEAPKTRADASYDWKVGDTAVHRLWGDGKVIEVSGEGKKMLLKLWFPNGDIRQVMVAFAPLTKK